MTIIQSQSAREWKRESESILSSTTCTLRLLAYEINVSFVIEYTLYTLTTLIEFYGNFSVRCHSKCSNFLEKHVNGQQIRKTIDFI